MSGKKTWNGSLVRVLACLGVLMVIGLTGCQVDIGGQTHPSPYYLTDDLYYPQAGAEFKLANEAAALRVSRADEALAQP